MVRKEIPTKIPKIKKLIFIGVLIHFKKKIRLIDQKNIKNTSVDSRKEEKRLMWVEKGDQIIPISEDNYEEYFAPNS